MSGEEKKKKSKLEKIYELQATNKGLKEENRSLRKELAGAKSGGNSVDDRSTASGNTEEKLMEAMKALKRVTVKQEMSLNTIRSKAEQRRKHLAQRDEQINQLQQELDSFKQAQAARKELESDGNAGNLNLKIDELEFRCAEQENRTKMLVLQLEASEDKARSLQKQLDSARNLMNKQQSSRSLKSSDTSASEFDLLRMKKELATKIEQIVLLEFDLEMCKDELHELQQKHNTPTNANQYERATDYQDEFFSDDEDDDDMW